MFAVFGRQSSSEISDCDLRIISTMATIYADPPSNLGLRHRLKLQSPIHTGKPVNAILDEELYLGPQFRLMQRKVVHRANPQDTLIGKRLSDAVHKSPTGAAEVVGHFLP